MNAENSYTTANFSQASLPIHICRMPKRNYRTSSFSSNTTAETIEILERSGRRDPVSIQIASTLVFAASAIMMFAALAVLMFHVPGVFEANNQFSLEDMVRALAGR